MDVGYRARRGDVYEELRPLLFSVAYRMVGSVSEAEDIVQEAFLRFHRETSQGASIDSPKAWLTTVTTRLSINQVRSARVRRERYVGAWLPEPLVTDPAPDASQHAETADSLSMAFLVLLESLSPVERAVFLLREVFDYDYGEIANVIRKREDNCRQIAARARRQVESKRPRFEASRARREELSRLFFEAIGKGDAQGLVRLLAADVVAYVDGGGKAAVTFPRPFYGAEHVARLLGAWAPGGDRFAVSGVRLVEINGQPGAMFLGLDGRVGLVVCLDIADGLVQAVRAISNREKLRHVDPSAGVPWQIVA